jgi:hypothetical protein
MKSLCQWIKSRRRFANAPDAGSKRPAAGGETRLDIARLMPERVEVEDVADAAAGG